MYKRLLSLLDDIKSNFLKPMKFHPLTDIIDNFVIKFYNFNEKTSPISILYETVGSQISDRNISRCPLLGQPTDHQTRCIR